MKVFLSGYGKMGRMLEELALERGWEVVGHADITCPEAYETAPGADVCLDFSGVGALKPLLGYLRRTKTALVSGTTGLTEPDLDALQELGRELPVIWTANYSTGIAVFRRDLRLLPHIFVYGGNLQAYLILHRLQRLNLLRVLRLRRRVRRSVHRVLF